MTTKISSNKEVVSQNATDLVKMIKVVVVSQQNAGLCYKNNEWTMTERTDIVKANEVVVSQQNAGFHYKNEWMLPERTDLVEAIEVAVVSQQNAGLKK